MTHRAAAVVFGAVAAGAVLASSVTALAGHGVWWLVAVSSALAAFALASRWAVAMGIAASVIGVAGVLLAGLLASAALDIPALVTAVVLLAGVGSSAIFVIVMSPTAIRRPTRQQAWRWFPALTGSVIWLATVALCQVIPGAARLSWVTTGDSASYIMNARVVTQSSGIVVGPGANQVPLPSALIALSDGAGWMPVAAHDVIAHELNSLAAAWTVSIAVICLLAGVFAASTVARARPRLAAVAGAGVSLLPLSWLIGTYAVEYGFYNAPIALALLLASAIVAYNGKQAPGFAAVLLVVAAVAMLATWSPLVVIPGALALHIVVENRRALLASPRWVKALIAVPVGGAIVFVLVALVPSYLADRGESLTADGGYFPLDALLPGAVFLLGAVVIVVGRRVGLARPAALLITILASCAIGVDLLLTRTGFAFTYYPQKFLWLAVSLALIVEVALVAAIISRVVTSRARSLVALGLVAAVTSGALMLVPTSKPGYDGRDLVSTMLTANLAYTSEPLTQLIIENTNPARPVYFWPPTSNDEFLPNFWLVLTHQPTQVGGVDLRAFAYQQRERTTAHDLCDLAAAFDAQLTVKTTYEPLASELAAACPDEAATVSVLVVDAF